MAAVSLLVFTLILCGYARAQDNKTVMDNEVSNRIDSQPQPPHQDNMDNLKYACGLTMERYNDTGEGGIIKESKMRPALVCCPGYRRDFRGICQPYCSLGCGDGFCESPEICSCSNNCAFNTVERRCACFAATCPGGCSANASCIADNICDCNFAFVKKSNWTGQYTNSTAECIPYCYPFCTNHFMSSSPEHCICNYTQGGNGTTFNNGSQVKSQEYLGHLFQSHGHPSFTTGLTAGLTGLALGALVGHMIGSRGKSKYNGGNIYSPGGYGNSPYGGGGYGHPGGYPNSGHNYGYGAPQNNPYGGSYGHPGVNYGQGVPPNTNYGHGVQPGTNYGQGVQPGTNYGQGVQPGTNYGHGVQPGTNYGHGVPPNTNYGAGGTYGNTGQSYPYPGNQGQPAVPGGNPYGGASAPPHPGTGNAQPGWNTPGQNAPNVASDVQQKTAANTYNSAPGHSSSGTNLGSGTNPGTGQKTNYGWNVPSGTNTAGSGGQTNYGWNVPSNTNTGSNTNAGTGTSSGGGLGSSSGRGNSGSSGKGSSGRKRGRKHRG